MFAMSENDVGSFQQNGYLFPLDVFTEAEAHDYRKRWENLEQKAGSDQRLREVLKSGANQVVPFIDEISRNPRITDRVASLLGPDLLLWACSLFIKEPRTRDFISWHQDVHYWGLDQASEVTAWLALSPATPESGCMRFVPGSHKHQVPHRDTFADGNMLSRGQEIAVEVDEGQAVEAVLRPGQMSLHHGLTFHASHPNRSGDRRIAFAFRYIPTSNRQAGREKTLASLVRGEDRYGHFDLVPPPERLLDPEAVERFHRGHTLHRAILLRGAERTAAR